MIDTYIRPVQIYTLRSSRLLRPNRLPNQLPRPSWLPNQLARQSQLPRPKQTASVTVALMQVAFRSLTPSFCIVAVVQVYQILFSCHQFSGLRQYGAEDLVITLTTFSDIFQHFQQNWITIIAFRVAPMELGGLLSPASLFSSLLPLPFWWSERGSIWKTDDLVSEVVPKPCKLLVEKIWPPIKIWKLLVIASGKYIIWTMTFLHLGN